MKRCFLFLFTLSFASVFAQQRARTVQDEQVYIDQLASIDSSAIPSFNAGTAAMDSGSYINACNHYLEVMAKAPEFAPAIRRYGWCEAKLWNMDTAIKYCERAYIIDDSWESALMLVNVYLSFAPGNTPEAEEYNRAVDLLDQWRDADGINKYEHLITSIQGSGEAGDLVRVDREIRRGLELFPDSMAIHYFATNLFVYYQQWPEAEYHLNRARELGLNEAAVDEILDNGVEFEMTFSRWRHRIWWSFIVWAIGLAALFLVGMLFSFFTLNKVEKQIAGGGPLKADGIRKVYRRLVNIAGIYYYLSLPFVLILLLIAVGGTIYLFGKIPIYFFFLILASGGTTIFFMIKTLVVKPKTEETGRVLKEEEAPALFALSREVAADMNTRPVEEIRLSPHVDMAVYERGKWREKIQDRATRVLIMGAGILQNFKVEEFRAVLAHEYGHFSNRDTAGGSVAFRVRRDIHHYAYALAVSGQARWWNLAFQFLRLYDFIFRRISHGAIRLQEILADRAAAEMYGAQAFEGGLRHVIVRDIEFNMIAGNEIRDAKNERRPFPNLYELPYRYKDKIDDSVKEYMCKKTTNDDTHPCPNDRFRYIEGIRGLKFFHTAQIVPELFCDWSAITIEQTKVVEEEWKAHPAPGM